jgi:hypothetical protein
MIHNDSTGFALAHSAHRSHHHMSHRSGSNNPNGTAGGATSLNGTGSSQFGGSVAVLPAKISSKHHGESAHFRGDGGAISAAGGALLTDTSSRDAGLTP